MSETPRTENHCICGDNKAHCVDCLFELSCKLETELAEARAEIERLKCHLEDESMRADGMTTAHAEADAHNYRLQELIEQMREALLLFAEGAIHDFHYVCQHRDNCLCLACQKVRVKAALAAERV